MADLNEQWNWSKFFGGFIDGRSYAKSIVFMFCSVVIITICFCVYSVVKAKFIKPIPVQTQAVGSNSGTITTDNKQETKKTWQLFGVNF